MLVQLVASYSFYNGEQVDDLLGISARFTSAPAREQRARRSVSAGAARRWDSGDAGAAACETDRQKGQWPPLQHSPNLFCKHKLVLPRQPLGLATRSE
eukprot:COSAG06_NODE_3903_length_4790_cov_53.937527_2_plen_98_part_00